MNTEVKKQKLLSISIAAYNVEKFLTKTLESFIDDRLKGLVEVLIINDGSNDDTFKIAKNFENNHPDIFIAIDKPNGGHGSTINKGIEIASGKYFCLLDGDDWYDTEEFIHYLYKLAEVDVDLIVNNFNLYNDSTGEIIPKEFKNIEYFKQYTFKELPSNIVMGLSAITLKTEILKNNAIIIDEHSFYVDMEFITYPVPFINTICFMPFFIYQYRVNQSNQSVSKNSLLKHIDNHLMVSHKLLIFMKKFASSRNFDTAKEEYLNISISKMIATQYYIFLLQKSNKTVYNNIINFDDFVKDNSPIIYKKLKVKQYIKFLRLRIYLVYKMLSMLVKIRE